MDDAVDVPTGYGVEESPPADAATCFHADSDCDTLERQNDTAEKLYAQFKNFALSPQRTEAERMWTAAEKLYYGFKATNSPNEVVIREAWRQVQTWVTQVSKALTAGDVLFKAEARLEGFEDEAEGATAVIHDQLKRSGSRVQQDMYIKCLALYGNAYMVAGYRRFKQCAYKMNPMHAPDENDWWEKETSEVFENLPFLENVSPWDVYCHPKIVEAKRSPFVFVVKEASPDGLKTLIREGWIDADATRAAVEAGQDAHDRPMRGDTMWDDDLAFLSDDDKPHELIICWSVDGWEHVVLDGQFLLRAMPLPGGEIPIINDQWDKMPDRHYSVGLPIIIGDEQRVVNQIIAYKLGNLALTSNPPLMTKRGTDAKKMWNNLTLASGGRTVFEVGSMDEATFMQVPQLQSAMSEEVAFWQQHQKEQTGITDRLSGNGPNSGTATGASQLSNNASERIGNTVRGMTPAFEEMYRWCYNLNARNLDETYIMRIVGADGANVFKRYTPEIFKPDIDVNVEIGGGVNAQQAMTDANNFKLLAQVPGLDILALADEVLKSSGKTRVKKFHTSSTNSQGDALSENNQLKLAGVISDPKPGDTHPLHVQIHQLFMQLPEFMALPPWFQTAMQAHVAIHMQFMQQMQAANGQMQQQGMSAMGGGQGPNGGATPVQQQANDSANSQFQMGARGAQQAGAA